MTIKPSAEKRESNLDLHVPDSGTTWSVFYDEIPLIPPEAMSLGDVLIVRHQTNPGFMFMQATAPHGNAWKLEAVELKKSEPCDA